MKNQHACATATLILAIAFAATIANFIYVDNTAECILGSIDALPTDIANVSESIEQLRTEWIKRRQILDLTLSKPALDKVSQLIDELDIAAAHSAESDYKTTMARLRRAIEDIRDPERILIRNIF